jgi:hypothetical protein
VAVAALACEKQASPSHKQISAKPLCHILRIQLTDVGNTGSVKTIHRKHPNGARLHYALTARRARDRIAVARSCFVSDHRPCEFVGVTASRNKNVSVILIVLSTS